MGKTRIAIVVFVTAVVLGPLYTAPGYSPIANTISQLAAQNTPHNYLMAISFLILGAAIIFEGVTRFRGPLVPFIAFGAFFGAAGVFGHRPISGDVPYSSWVDATHSALATLSGVALTLGFMWQALRARSAAHRLLSATLAAVCVVFPLLMLNASVYQGAIQRAMYLIIFAWLWAYYPNKTHA
jgi:hypothetical membrane protein